MGTDSLRYISLLQSVMQIVLRGRTGVAMFVGMMVCAAPHVVMGAPIDDARATLQAMRDTRTQVTIAVQATEAALDSGDDAGAIAAFARAEVEFAKVQTQLQTLNQLRDQAEAAGEPVGALTAQLNGGNQIFAETSDTLESVRNFVPELVDDTDSDRGDVDTDDAAADREDDADVSNADDTADDNPEVVPLEVASGGLVPCGNGSSMADRCRACDFIVLAHNIISYISRLLVIACILVITLAGVAYIISTGSNLTSWAKTAVKNALIGFTIVLVAWVVITFIIRSIAADDSNSLQIYTKQASLWTFTCNAEGVR